MRKRLPGAHPVAEIDAALARAGIRTPFNPGVSAVEFGTMGIRGTAAVAVSHGHPCSRIDVELVWPQARPVLTHAVRRRLDRGARSAGARRRYVLRPLRP